MEKENSFGLIPILKRNNEILFLVISHNAGHWAFPKGHKEKGESDIETAKREFKEETGIKDFKIIDEDAYFEEKYLIKIDGKDLEKTVKYFICATKTQEVVIQEKEIKSFKWLNFEDTNSILTYKEAKEILRKANNYLHGK